MGYSKYFHRLAGKSQIISPSSTLELTHDRKTHAEKVSQMAEAISRHLLEVDDATRSRCRRGLGLDPYVAKAAAASHDLGHPPFGHVGEEELDALGSEFGVRFQANAQSFRIVCKLAVHPGVERGLDLTAASRLAILKYPWPRGGGNSPPEVGPDRLKYWGIYESELPDFTEAAQVVDLASFLPANQMTLEAEIMDLADDMTYALHDFEDFYNLGELAIPQLLSEGFWSDLDATQGRLSERYPIEFRMREFIAADATVRAYLEQKAMAPLRRPNEDLPDQERAMRMLTSHFLTRWLHTIDVDDYGQLTVAPSTWHEVNVLKQLAWERVITQPTLRVMQEGDRRIVRDLARMLIDAYTKDTNRVPSRLRSLIALGADDPDWPMATVEQVLGRGLLDYISWLTDLQARQLHGVMSGSAEPRYGRSWIR